MMAHHTLFLSLTLGILGAVIAENISIQYVIIHTSSDSNTTSSSNLTSAINARPASIYQPSSRTQYPATSTEVYTATSIIVTAEASGTATVTAAAPLLSAGGWSSVSSVSRRVQSASTSPLISSKGSEKVFAVTYEHQIPGVPGKDYPIFATIPPTQFQCSKYQTSGYYADQDASCQVIHICQQDGTHESFLCPNGTIFNQQFLVCDWWFNVDCAKSGDFYNLNVEFGRTPDLHNQKPDYSDNAPESNQQHQVEVVDVYDTDSASSAEATEYADYKEYKDDSSEKIY